MQRKAGILTFHRAVNYGAVLQAYALQAFMNENGIDVEVIDYRNSKIEEQYKPVRMKFHNIKELAYDVLTINERRIRRKKFDRFINQYFRVSDCMYDRESIEKSCKIYDELWTGSDQVWDLRLSGGDLTYLLDFCREDKKYSYAASIGKSVLDHDEAEIFSSHLETYRAISVREETGRALLKKRIDKDIRVVLDPVFLLTKEQWRKIAVYPRITEDYIFIYKIADSRSFDYALRLSMEEKCKAVVLQAPHRHMPHIFRAERCVSPQEWIGWLDGARFIVTDSFHASAFSVIFEKKFLSFKSCSINHKNCRIYDMLKLFDLESRFRESADGGSIKEEIDYGKVKDRLASYIQMSENFIMHRV